MLQRIASKCIVDAKTGCLECKSSRINGYAKINAWTDGKSVGFLAHRVVYEAFFGPIPDGYFIEHTCGNRACCRIDHMKLFCREERKVSPVERILKRSKMNKKTGCIECNMATANGGYSLVTLVDDSGPRLRRVHRVVYEALVGPIPDGMTIDHVCKNPKCCRTDHLRLLTASDNAKDSAKCRANRAKTHCPKGHTYDGKNTYQGKSGRACRKCQAERATRSRGVNR